MIRHLFKYLMPLTEKKTDIIALADQMESRHECQTLAVGVAESAEIVKQGSYTIPVLGPARIIIVKENSDGN